MITRTHRLLGRSLVAALALGATLGFSSTAQASPNPVVGHVYQATNNAAGNAIAVFDRTADGSLRARGTVATGGKGTGASLASQGGVTRDGSLLFVVNGGDDSVSVLSTKGGSVRLRDRISSGGDRPVSVTVHHGVGYVLNHDSDTIAGFRYTPAGDLRRLRGSARHLTHQQDGMPTDAAQIQFSPRGHRLVVTERGANAIDTFVVRRGYAGQAHAHPSVGMVPYGFDFGRHSTLVVSEAASGSASSYRVGRHFRPITKALGDTQAAACWVVVSGHYAWVVNAASNSISSYRVHSDGSLTLAQAVAGATGAGPTDAAATPDGRYLQVRLGDGSVQSFRIDPHGTLTSVDTERVTMNFGVAGLATD